MALVAEDDFDSDQEFCWTGDDNGFDYSLSVGSSSHKPNVRVAPYPSCFQVSVMSSSPSHASVGFFILSASSSSSTACSSSPHSISTALQSLLQWISQSSIFPDSGCRLKFSRGIYFILEYFLTIPPQVDNRTLTLPNKK